MASATKATLKKAIRDRFIAALRKHRSVTKACEAIGKNRTTSYRWRDKFPKFAKEWDEAVETNIDDLEAGNMKRAIEGWLEPVFYKGKMVGSIRKFSTGLSIYMLKKLRPKIYADDWTERANDDEQDVDETFL